MDNDDQNLLLPSIKVAKRYSVTLKTIARWSGDPRLNFPEPVRINGRKYWRLGSLSSWERARAAPSRRTDAKTEARNGSP